MMRFDRAVPHRSLRGPLVGTARSRGISAFTARRNAPLPTLQAEARLSHYDDLGADADATVEVDHVVIGQPEAARGYRGADRLRLVGAVDAEERGAEIHGTGAERVLRPALHEP